MTKSTARSIQAHVKPPRSLPAGASRIWKRTVRVYPYDWFNEGDIPLLRAFSVLAFQLEEMERTWDVEDEYRKVVRETRYLAEKLRLAPSARYDVQKAGSADRKAAQVNQVDETWEERLERLGPAH